MTETTGNNQRRTFKESWKSFDQKTTKLVRKYAPSVCLFISMLFFVAALLWNLIDEMDQSIYCLLLAGLSLGIGVFIPFLIKHNESEATRKD